MPGRWPKPRFETDLASGTLLTVGELMRGEKPRFKSTGEGARFSFAAERDGVLVETDLPLGCCHFFYQDLHC